MDRVMVDDIERRRQARDYDDWLRRKVEAARASMRAGRGRSNDAVEATFAARRNHAETSQA